MHYLENTPSKTKICDNYCLLNSSVEFLYLLCDSYDICDTLKHEHRDYFLKVRRRERGPYSIYV